MKYNNLHKHMILLIFAVLPLTGVLISCNNNLTEGSSQGNKSSETSVSNSSSNILASSESNSLVISSNDEDSSSKSIEDWIVISDDEINVVENGADPSGNIDNTELLIKLHATGKKIYYPNGTYLFNGENLDLSGGVKFESLDGVLVRNSISDVNILNFDDSGVLIGLMQNHLELTEYDRNKEGTTIGNIVAPPISTKEINTKIDLIAHWYNDAGLTQKLTGKNGWLGWYYWTWNHHNTEELMYEKFGGRIDPYDPSRQPLLGYYRGDDANVLDWQCYWLREYGATAVSLINMPANGYPILDGIAGFEDQYHIDHWIYVLMNDVPNFKNIKYIMTGATPWLSSINPSDEPFEPYRYEVEQVRKSWIDLIELVYFKYNNFYSITKDGKEYPVINVISEQALIGAFDSYTGYENTLNFYKTIAKKFKDKGYGGFAIIAGQPIPQFNKMYNELDSLGIIRYPGGYNILFSGGDAYSDLAANLNPPNDNRWILSVVTSFECHSPHPTKIYYTGSTPDLFQQYLQKTVDYIEDNDFPKMVTCYNVAEWAEGGPGLQPNVRDRFGYLDAMKNVIMK